MEMSDPLLRFGVVSDIHARLAEDGKSLVDGLGIETFEEALREFQNWGADAVVVGSAITRPHLIAKRFVDLMGGLQDDWRTAERAKH